MSLPHVMLGRRAVCFGTTLEGSQSSDSLTIIAGDGHDAINAKGGDDTITLAENTTGILVDAGGGDDTVYLQDGSSGNTLSGGSGSDTLSLEQLSTGVTIDLRDSAGSGQVGAITQGTTLLAEVDNTFERIVGTLYDDVIYTGRTSQIIEGGGGNDIVDGGQGHDSLIGGDGADTFAGGQGNDWMNGGGGADTVDYSSSSSGVIADLGTGTGAGGDAQGDSYTGIENLTGSAFGDTLTGDAGNNMLIGGGGSDTLVGGSGFDTAVYTGLLTDYVITQTGEDSWSVADSAGSHGTDTLSGIESIVIGGVAYLLVKPQVTIADAEITEGGVARLTVSLSTPFVGAVIVHWRTVAGTATAGADYTPEASGVLVIPPGVPFGEITVPVPEDALNEGNETFQVIIDSVENGILLDGQAVVTIFDNEPPPPANHAPTAGADAFTLQEDGTLLISAADLLANDTDVDGGDLSVTGVALAAGMSGTLVANGGGTWTYTPGADFNGTVDLTYTVSDGEAVSAGAVTVTIDPVNDAPVLDAAPELVLAAIDEDSASVAFSVADIVADGSITDADVTVAPEAIAITGVSHLGWQYWAGSAWAAVGAVSETNALLLDSANQLRFGPAANVNGTASFTFRAWDKSTGAALGYAATGTSAFSADSKIVEITINPVSDTPFLSVEPASGSGNGAIELNIVAGLTDTDGSESLSITISGVPAGAQLSAGTNLNDGTWTLSPAQLSGLTITPPAGFDADFTLAVSATATDNAATPASTSANLEVRTPPRVSLTAPAEVIEGGTVGFRLSLSRAVDRDVSVVLQFGGSATPGSDYVAPEHSFSVVIPAGTLSVPLPVGTMEDSVVEADETISLTITEASNALIGTAGGTSTVLDDDTPLFAQSAALGLPVGMSADWHVKATGGLDGLSYALGEGPAHGTVTVDADGTYHYQADSGYTGTDSFTFTATDGRGVSNVGEIAVSVHEVQSTQVTLDPSLVTTTTSFAAGNLTITPTTIGQFANARSTAPLVDGTYWEITTGTNGLSYLWEGGIVGADCDLSTQQQPVYLSGGAWAITAASANYPYNVAARAQGESSWQTVMPSTGKIGSVAMFAYRDGKLWFGMDGVWVGDPVAGTGATYSNLTAAPGPLYAFVNTYYDNNGGNSPTINFGATPFAHDAPVGFSELASHIDFQSTAGDDLFVGGLDDDAQDGGLGDDRLEGGGGNDTLNGGAGNDTLLGGENAPESVAYANLVMPGATTELSNDGHTVRSTSSGQIGIARSSVPISDGAYWEIKTGTNGSSYNWEAGLVDDNGSFWRFTANANSYPYSLVTRHEGSWQILLPAAGQVGSVAMFAYRDGQIWVGMDGVWVGNPLNGTGAAYSGLTTSGPLHAFVQTYYDGNGSGSPTIDFGSDPFMYAPPVGFAGLSTNPLPSDDVSGDVLFGGAGDDLLTGGGGDDALDGGDGTDTYYSGRNEGADVIDNRSHGADGDKVQFGDGVAHDQLWFQHVGEDLKVSIIGTSDSMTIQSWYADAANHVSKFETADGQVLADAQVDHLVQAMASFAPPPLGQTQLTTEQHQQLDPVIAANWQAS